MNKLYIYALWIITVLVMPVIAGLYPNPALRPVIGGLSLMSFFGAIYIFRSVKSVPGKVLAVLAAIVFAASAVGIILAIR
jgi:hypothetical protein